MKAKPKEPSPLSPHIIRAFHRRIWSWFKQHRRELPWRETLDPYPIAVSEIMLQQTQVNRVLQKYPEFLKIFPTWRALAKAPLRKVLTAWQGLGYNRRARALHELAKVVTRDFHGTLPEDRDTLCSLPGIGSYTAAAIRVFVFHLPEVVIETNIRAVYINEFFPERARPRDTDLLPLIEATIAARNPREWYYALMDYGSELKRQDRTIGKRSAHYSRQSPFRGSTRELRGKIVRLLSKKGNWTERQLQKECGEAERRVSETISGLCRDGLVRKIGRRYSI